MDQAARAPAARGFAPLTVIAVCFTIAVLEGYDIQAMGVAAPTLAPALHLAKDQVGVAASAAMLGLVFGAMFGGWLADRVGRKPVLVAATIWFGVFSLVTSVTWDFPSLVMARLITGLGFGAAMPNLIAVATELSSPRRQASAVTAMFVGMPAGGSLAALLTRFAPAEFDWRLIFEVGGAAPLLIAPFAWFLLPETRPSHTGRRDTAGALFGEGRAGATLLMWLAFAAATLILHLMLNWLPSLVIAKGLTRDDATSAALAFNLAGIAGSLSLGMAADRFGFRWPLTGAFAILVAVMAALAAASGQAPILILSGCAGFLVVGAQFTLYALAPRRYPPQVRASGSGAAVAAGRVGSVIGPLVGGWLLAGGASAGQVVGALVPVVLIAGAAAFLTTRLGRDYSV